ncbi:MAG: sulfide/dihydroorotate dehydrogenase-like FAD/NAD-binding protein [Methanothrix sp.]|nr:sulfide/dihydroorotate dehydrogenase-like FAD/NAD-binding protein [Methanothrix sp.]OYV12249.1 MAG: ferredoxin--NADP+ reductase [Methanosaeta sp. ASO1]
MFPIVRRKEMAGGKIILNEILAPKIARVAQPGQFVILMAGEKGERIPMTISDMDPVKGTITIIYHLVGRSTVAFGRLQAGEGYSSVAGPLGLPTEAEGAGLAVCVGGGTGLAVLYPIAKKLKSQGSRVISIMGARTAELVILKEEMAAVSDDLLICTDDGSLGRKALVTELLKEVLERERPDLVVAVGPVMMMKLVSEITRPQRIKTIVSLNPIMIDGTGMCGSCRVEVGGETKLACVDGPEFDGHRVNYDLLLQRLQAFREEEHEAMMLLGEEMARCPMKKEMERE